MRTTCSLENCKEKISRYCLDHEEALCHSCKHAQHYCCDTIHIIPVKSLECQLDQIHTLLVSTEEFVRRLKYQNDFNGALGKLKVEFIAILKRVTDAIENQKFLEFEANEKAIDEFRKKIDKDEGMQVLMSRIYQQCVLKTLLPARIKNLSKIDEEELKDMRSTILDGKNGNQSNNSQGIKKFKSDIIGSSSPTTLADLRKKYFSQVNDVTKFCDIEIYPKREKFIGFMEESIQNNVQFVESRSFSFRELPGKCQLLNSYLSKCLPREFSGIVNMNNGRTTTYVKFAEYNWSIEALLKTNIRTLSLNKFVLSEEDFELLKNRPEESMLAIDLTNCLFISSCGKKLSLITEEQIKEHLIRSNKIDACSMNELSRMITL
ncbi:unnamed protein product [Moneuplotes crassus]|uniref:Uncharacterized protein n=1 Tax=Euplotes crassus TaxID=5936 RepID=A0AAD1X6K9_EUPCR|nr:unnamed protein product [Moneuplotes crassus]